MSPDPSKIEIESPFSGLQPIGCCQVGSISKRRATSGVTG